MMFEPSETANFIVLTLSVMSVQTIEKSLLLKMLVISNG